MKNFQHKNLSHESYLTCKQALAMFKFLNIHMLLFNDIL